ncbi:hypothetical protein EVG20_g10067, partial [Dentipellis fragilis]
MRWKSACIAWAALSALASVNGQVTCENDGVPANSSACFCPPGFGGPTCSSPACGGDIFQNTQRPLVTGSSATSFGNLTLSGCSCETGWTGTGCNVCQSPSVCQSAFSANGGNTSSTSAGADGLSGTAGLNDTLTCNTAPRVWASGEMSCQVSNPTLQAIYPGTSTLTILRTLNTSLTPSPNITSFGPSGSVFAQLWYDGVEQFYCMASSCTQSAPGDGTASWLCHDLSCTCRPNTTFCGAVPLTNLTSTIDGLGGDLTIGCGALASENGTATCEFQQAVLQNLFGSAGLPLSGCTFGECVRQGVIDAGSGNTDDAGAGSGGGGLSHGVIAGLAVIGGLIGLALVGLLVGWWNQRKARRGRYGYAVDGNGKHGHGGVTVEWSDVSYVVPTGNDGYSWMTALGRGQTRAHSKTVLDGVSGKVVPGQMMGILGPSGTLFSSRNFRTMFMVLQEPSGEMTGVVSFPEATNTQRLRIGFVPQQDVLPHMLTVFEALLFAARLRLPENVSDAEKQQRVHDVVEQLGLSRVSHSRIGGGAFGGGEGRGISGGEMRRVSIGLELVASPDVLILDEPTSGLDSVSASKVARVLHAVAHDPENPTAVIASIHQPSSQLYHTFDQILLLAQGRALYSGVGGFSPVEHFSLQNIAYHEGYNVADHLLEIASDPPSGVGLSIQGTPDSAGESTGKKDGDAIEMPEVLKLGDAEKGSGNGNHLGGGRRRDGWMARASGAKYAATFLTQLEVLSGREWKILRRDKTLFFTHVAIASVLGVFCGGLYFHTGTSIAGFQSRVGCLFFLGALIAFSSLSALYNVVEFRPLFLRERSSSYYSPTAWLMSRFIFDAIPLRIIPTIVVSTITYWMAGLAPHPANFFKFLFILVLYTLAMTLFNFLLACLFRNGGLAILLSALSALYQMTYAGFFVHLDAIPPVLRWLQWLCPLKYTLEALSVNEVGSGLMIQDTLQGVPVDVSATLIMNLLFGFGDGNYYRDVLVLFAFIAGFAVGVVGIVWL